MEAVTQFNNELTGLHDCKPPISKAKMTSITKAAIKSVKLYKHVVQGVEKFIQKCRSEFKVPGLYVIDSIVRQSRHQFGPDKDVFATRFARNFNITFQNLFKCPAEEKPKIVRVLNLWQKNAVFSADVIQPLLDMANPNHVIHQQATPTSTGTPGTNSVKKLDNMAWNNWGNENSEGQSDQSDSQLKPLMQLMQSQQMLPFSAMSNVFQGSSQANSNDAYTDNTLVMQFQQIANLLSQQADTKRTEQETVKFNKKLLDFDYSDEEEEEDEKKEEPVTQNTGQNLALNMAQNLLSNPDLLKQLQQMQQTLQQTELLKTELSMQEQLSKQRMWSSEELMQSINSAGQNQAYGLQAQQMQMSHVPYEMPQVPPLQQSVVNVGLAAGNIPLPTNLGLPPSFVPIPPVIIPPSVNQDDFEIIEIDKNTGLDARINEHHQYDDHSLEDMETSENESSRPPIKRRERTRSRSPSRSRRRGRRSRSRSKTRRSRSRSSSRTRKYRRGDRRSRSKERDREREKEKEREKEREKEKERKKRGLPPLKKDFLSVCSTTLWLGHVSKLVSEEDLADQFGEFGDIVTIDLIPPRGCAFVCMNRRQDAYRALTKLKNLKLHGKSITMAWAPGKGVKGKDYKDYWDADLGVSYIPFEKIPENVDLEGLEDGGMMDEDSMSDRLKEQQKAKESVKNRGKKEGEIDASGDKKDEKEIILNGSVKSASITIDSSSALPISIPQMPQYGLSNMVSGQNLSMMQMMAPNVGQASLLGHPVAGNLSGGVNMSLVGSFNMANSAASMVLGGHSSSILENLTKEAKKLKDTPDVKDTNTSVGLQQEIKKSESLDSGSAADKLDTSTSSIPLPPENGLKSAFDTSSIDSTRNALVGDVKNIDPSASSLALGVAMNSLAAPLTGGVGAPFSSMAFSSSGVMPMTGVTQGFQNAMDFGIQNPFQAPPPFNPMMPPPLFQPCFPLMRPLGSTSDNSLVSPNDLPKLGQWRPNFPAPNSHQRSNNFQDKDSKLSDATRNSDNNLDKMSRDLGGNKLSPRSAGHHLSGSNRLRPPGPLNDTRHDRGAAPDLVDDQGTHRSLNREAMLDHIDPPLLGPRHGSRFGHPPSRFGDFDDGEGFRLPRPGDLNSNNDFPPDVRMRFMPRGPGLPGPPRPMMGRFPMGPRMGGPPGFPRFPPSVLPHRGHPDRPPGFQGMMPPGRGGFPLPLRAPVRGPHPMDRNRLDMGRDRMLHDRHFGGGPPDFDFDPEQPEFNRFEDRDRREGNFRRDGPHHADWHHLPRDRRDSWKESEDEFDRELRPDLRERRTEERREHSRPPVGEWGRGRDNNKEEVRGREERNSRWERSRDRDRDRDTDRDRDREIDRDRDRETDRDRDREKRDRRDSDRDHTTKLDKSIDSHENYKKLINKEEVQFNVKEEEVHFNAKEEVQYNAKDEVQYNAKDEVQFNAKEEVHFDIKEDEKENIAIFDAVKEEETPFTSTELVSEPAEELFGLVKEDCNDGSVINAADE